MTLQITQPHALEILRGQLTRIPPDVRGKPVRENGLRDRDGDGRADALAKLNHSDGEGDVTGREDGGGGDLGRLDADADAEAQEGFIGEEGGEAGSGD